jgi:SNF2 family DNA or RNA helicase
LDEDYLAEQDWAGLILDEAQFVKNHQTKAHRAIRNFRAGFKLAITGTPMENTLADLWSIFRLVVPGMLPRYSKFRDDFLRPIEAGQRVARTEPGTSDEERADQQTRSREAMDKLRTKIRPFMLRRTKESVAAELPDKQEMVLQVPMEPEHDKLYQQILQRERKNVLNLVTDMESNRMSIFRSLTLMRMLALDPAIVDDEYAHVPSSKLNELMSRLSEILPEGHRVLIFSQFTSFLARLGQELDGQDIDYAYLDGSTRDRGAVVEQFRSGDAPVFLISLRAGGFGLTLTEADYVFLLDPWWNPAVEAQAVDRAHRIGQDKNVMVYRMVSKGSIEEKVLALQQQKVEMFDALTEDDTAFSSNVTAEDIRALFDDSPIDLEEIQAGAITGSDS